MIPARAASTTAPAMTSAAERGSIVPATVIPMRCARIVLAIALPPMARNAPSIAPIRPISVLSVMASAKTRHALAPRTRKTATWRRRSSIDATIASMMLIALETSTTTAIARKSQSISPTIAINRPICCAGWATVIAMSRRSRSNWAAMDADASLPGRVGSRSRIPVMSLSASVKSAASTCSCSCS